ncbi:MAG TPA: Rrf2 family transcriptional regulator [Clostridia bacterium]|nr:Rrf2 family transcriptional regulator [Clostridia bacterium]
MMLSTRGRYGVKALYELARAEPSGSPVSLREIAECQGLSLSYLEQLIGPLRRAGLVVSVRGAKGGYILGRPRGEITVGDIIRVMEGSIAPTECVADSPDGVSHCGRSQTCIAKGIWERVKKSVEEVLDSITLEDLCGRDGTEEANVVSEK